MALLALVSSLPPLAGEQPADSTISAEAPALLSSQAEVAQFWTAACERLRILFETLEAEWAPGAPQPPPVLEPSFQEASNAAVQAQMLLEDAFQRLDPASACAALVLTTLAEFDSYVWHRYLASLSGDPNWMDAAQGCLDQCLATGDIADRTLGASAPDWSALSAAVEASARLERLTNPSAEYVTAVPTTEPPAPGSAPGSPTAQAFSVPPAAAAVQCWGTASARLRGIFETVETQWPLVVASAPAALDRLSPVVRGAAAQSHGLLEQTFGAVNPLSLEGALVMAALAEFNAYLWHRYLATFSGNIKWIEAAKGCLWQCAATGDEADAVLGRGMSAWPLVSAAAQRCLPEEGSLQAEVPAAEIEAPYAYTPPPWVMPIPVQPMPTTEPSYSAPGLPGATAAASRGADQVVYITRAGAKYHSAACRYARAAIPVLLSQAQALGYTPCSLCW